MKIIILSVDFLPNIGGIAAHVYELSKELINQGHEVFVVSYRNKRYNKNYEEIYGIKIYRVYLPGIKKDFRLPHMFYYIFYVPFELIKLKKLIYKEKIDIIHSHNVVPDGFVAKLIKGIPKVETEHSSGFLIAVETKKRHKILVYKWILSDAEVIIGPSSELVENFIKIGISPHKTRFISNGVDTKKFNPKIDGNEIRKRHGIKEHEKVVLCPRRLEPKNGVYYFIKAVPYIIKDIPNVKFLVVGDGSEMKKLQNEVKKLGISDYVIFTGRISNSEMPKYYAISDIVVLPSLKEATSIAGLEAMAMGRPLIGTNVGGIPEIIINDKTGILVPPENPKKLAEAIVRLLYNSKIRNKMKINARKYVERKYSWEVITKKIIKEYKKALKTSHLKKD